MGCGRLIIVGEKGVFWGGKSVGLRGKEFSDYGNSLSAYGNSFTALFKYKSGFRKIFRFGYLGCYFVILFKLYAKIFLLFSSKFFY